MEAVPSKTKNYAHVVPGDPKTYIFGTEAAYAADYQSSVFGYTWKKGGWDCLRHYEILANGCIPWFRDLASCPADTLTHFPKDLVREAMESDTPEAYIPQLLDYTRTHLTCRAMAQYLLDTVGCPRPARVLMLCSDSQPDYLRCLTLIGLKQILGNRCAESVYVPHIYRDFRNASTLYGKGFSYSCILPVSAKPPPIHIDELRNHSFDLIVYGSVHRGLPYYDEIRTVYRPNEIIMLCGEDTCENCPARMHPEHPCFIRELPFSR